MAIIIRMTEVRLSMTEVSLYIAAAHFAPFRTLHWAIEHRWV